MELPDVSTLYVKISGPKHVLQPSFPQAAHNCQCMPECLPLTAYTQSVREMNNLDREIICCSWKIRDEVIVVHLNCMM